MDIEIIKLGKGHTVKVGGKILFWVIGSKKNAQKELAKHIKKN